MGDCQAREGLDGLGHERSGVLVQGCRHDQIPPFGRVTHPGRFCTLRARVGGWFSPIRGVGGLWFYPMTGLFRWQLGRNLEGGRQLGAPERRAVADDQRADADQFGARGGRGRLRTSQERGEAGAGGDEVPVGLDQQAPQAHRQGGDAQAGEAGCRSFDMVCAERGAWSHGVVPLVLIGEPVLRLPKQRVWAVSCARTSPWGPDAMRLAPAPLLCPCSVTMAVITPMSGGTVPEESHWRQTGRSAKRVTCEKAAVINPATGTAGGACLPHHDRTGSTGATVSPR